MISYRQADLLDRLKPQNTIIKMRAEIFPNAGNVRVSIIFINDPPTWLHTEINKVILGYDDFRRMPGVAPLKEFYRSQAYVSDSEAKENLMQIINGLGAIKGVKDINYHYHSSGYVMNMDIRI